MKRLSDINYTYNSLSVPGGGFVTGFVFHPYHAGILYARTDIGGIYRFDYQSQRWVSLSDHLTEYTRHLAQPLALALNAERPEMLYAMCGNSSRKFGNGKSALLISSDCGNSFTEKPVPFFCNGNAPARSTADRLAHKNGVLYFGSQENGLWRSSDNGDTWTRLQFPEENIVFVYVHPKLDIMVVSCTGETYAKGTDRAHTLYVSYDCGESFEPLAIPQALNDNRFSHNGFVAGALSCCSDSIYVTFTHTVRSNPWGGWNSFACDNGGGADGRLFRYNITDGRLRFAEDITPVLPEFHDESPMRRLPFGLGGIDVCGNAIAVCSVGGHGDAIFISKDGGKSYSIIRSTDLQSFSIDVPYLRPKYNAGRVPLHWMSCLRIDPFDPDFAVINTGTGVFALRGLTTDEPYVTDLCLGMEETVHMNIYGIPKGKNKVIDLVGDLGGFAFRELDRLCENSFADESCHRYITCLNADYVSSDPDIFATTARGNWTSHTKGGVILTSDGGDSFTHIGYPTGISDDLDEISAEIQKPNTNSGWVAVTADGNSILWTLAYKYMQLPCFAAVRYELNTKAFTKIRIYDAEKNDISESEHHIKIFTDRINHKKAYGFGEKGQLYVSTDGGVSFYQAKVSECFPDCRMSGIDGHKGCEIRFLPTEEGVCYAALQGDGLWRIHFDGYKAFAERISDEGDTVNTVGFGAGASDDMPALYISGMIFGEYGFWRSFDSGESWARINSDKQMYGHITSMDGDFRKKGRVFIATGCRGGFYGEEE